MEAEAEAAEEAAEAAGAGAGAEVELVSSSCWCLTSARAVSTDCGLAAWGSRRVVSGGET